MKIVILGWYGTETLGDRGILYGLIEIFKKAFNKVDISIGSIYPFFTERSLYEDREYIGLIGNGVKVKCFDVKDRTTLKFEVENSDLTAMGGGPIMDLNDLGIIEYAFGVAKKSSVKTALLGCGVGPLFHPKFQKISLHILNQADLIILRDEISKNNAIELENVHNIKIQKDIKVTFDPAILPVRTFLKNNMKSEGNNDIAINFREFPIGNFRDVDVKQIDKLFIKTIDEISKDYDRVKLFPMHTFSVGGDDREYLSKIKFGVLNSNVEVINKPLSLWNLFELNFTAKACIGMRYHSIVFQTLLNKNNLIFDYTEANRGKISGFLDMIGGKDFYKHRYINIQSLMDEDSIDTNQLLEHALFTYDEDIFDECEKVFISNLESIF